jgi:hypothetical protein
MLLEAQIKGGVPQPASQWSLCAGKPERELESRERGRGRKTDTVQRYLSLREVTEDDVKRGARWRMYPA